MSPLTLKRIRRRKGAPLGTKKLTKLIKAHGGDDEGETASVPANEIWRVILACDSAGKRHLKQCHKEDKQKAKRKAKKAKKRAAKEKNKHKKKRTRRVA